MKVSTEQSIDRQAIVEIQLEPEELEAAMERAYRRVVRQVNIHGFRPGKAPRRIVEQRLGRGILIEEAARELVPKLTGDVIDEQKLDAIRQPDVEITALEPLTFKATIPLRPTVTLGDYHSVRVQPREVEVTEEKIDEVIERLREGRATWIVPEQSRAAMAGDRVKINLASSVDGEPLDEAQQGLTADLGGSSDRQPDLLPEIEAAIIGLLEGQSAEATVSFPADYRQEKVAGKTVTFSVALEEIREKQMPVLDNEFVQTVSDVGTVAELRERVRTNLASQSDDAARNEVTRAIIDLVSQQATIEMPPILVADQIELQLAERRQLFERQGIQWRRVLELSNQSEEQVREEMQPEAERRVRNSLVLLEIAKAEELAVTPEELEAEIERLVATYGAEDQNRIRQAYSRDEARNSIESGLFERKILDRLIEITTEGHGYAVAPGQGGIPLGLAASEAPAAAATETTEPAAAEAAPATLAAPGIADATSGSATLAASGAAATTGPAAAGLADIVDKAYETLEFDQLAEAPVVALQGLSAADATALQAAFGIVSIADLANHPFVAWAQAITTIAEADEETTTRPTRPRRTRKSAAGTTEADAEVAATDETGQ